MFKYCKYCGQSNTKLDKFGYCKEYNCFEQSGMKSKLDNYIKQINTFWFKDDSHRQTSKTVTSYYNINEYEIYSIMKEVEKDFKYIPLDILNAIPFKYRNWKKWDRNGTEIANDN